MSSAWMRALSVACTLGAAFGRAHGSRAAELLLAQPSPCAIGDELLFRAERALGRPLAAAADVRCTIHMAHAAGAFTARLELARADEPAHLRSFSAPSCEALTDTLALALVLAVGGATETGDAPSSTLELPGAALPPAPISRDAASAAAAPMLEETRGASAAQDVADGSGANSVPAAAPPAWKIRGALAADAGSLPGFGLGAQLGASVGWSELELRALGSYFPSRDASVESLSGAPIGAQLGLAAGSLLLCVPALARAARVALGACGGAELGALSGEGSGLSEPRASTSPWAAALGELSASWALGQGGLALEALLGAAVPLVRDDFTVVDAGSERVVHRPVPVAVRASIGVGISLD